MSRHPAADALLTLLLALLTPALPATALEQGPAVDVALVVDGRTLALADGSTLRLAGLAAPPDAAREALEALAAGGPWRLAFDGAARDRHGRLVAHAYAADGRWVQGELLARGLARVQTLPGRRALAAAMLAVEGAAREARHGLWAGRDFAILDAHDGNWPRGGFVLVEGRVTEAATVAGRAFLNFGEDRTEDFTITIAPADLKPYMAEGGQVEALAGRRLRVRGWLDWYNGPEIAVSHREQIEVLDP